MFATAPMPIRAHTSITLSAGMLNIPLSVYTSTEETRVSRKEFLNGDTNVAVGRAAIRKDTGEVVDNLSVTRMAEASNGTWVTLTDDEIAACTSERGLAEVVTFVPAKDVSMYLVEGLYQVRPKIVKGKPDTAASRALAMLFAGMKARKVVALVKVAMRGPARYALLDSDGNFVLIRTADAVRKAIPLDDEFHFTKGEIAMVTTFIETFGIDTPVITDDTAPVVQAYVDAKAGGAPTKKVAQPPVATDDLMAAFEASISAAKAKKGKVA